MALNNLNKNKTKATVRFPLQEKVKNSSMKVNIILQASLGSLSVTDPGLTREMPRCVRIATRIAECLMHLVWSQKRTDGFELLKNSLLLCKSLRCGVWDNSPNVMKQMDRVGLVLLMSLAAAGYKTFKQIALSNPAMLEQFVNRAPPFGTSVRDFAASRA